MHILYMLPKVLPKRAKTSKNEQKFYCEFCDYSTSRNNNYIRHLSSKKHLKNALPSVTKMLPKCYQMSKNEQKRAEIVKNVYICEHCNKEYNSRKGLWGHKKKCKIVDYVVDSDENVKLKLELAEKNIELAEEKGKNKAYKEIIENKGLGNVINNNNGDNYNNCNNTNNISLNVFLNDYCKDAINLEDFMKGIKFKLKDVLNESGYIDNCVSVKLLNDLNDMPVTQRPIHCTDKRRKNFVVKDKEEGWITEKGNQTGKD